ncbi:hypothetical protein BUALT_Bualt13G0094000 [Buddleja alternifolia]|uniref:Protein EARLY FLOWERING 4 domain-containing protein n=1 Tax=Buddleja alternifolia TaxID=168488 RepID=A0AAV6WN43_9LAMI|nr:hypothetical protein BUALT_Bualt13G0094000 [Buddleja alternifolia]
MDDTSQTLTTAGGHSYDYDFDEEEKEEDFCDVETWETLSKSFKEVQSVLDHNRRLIQQVNDNHRSKIPRNMTKNVELIREINSNMSKVISLYSNLSKNFSNSVQQRRAMGRENIGQFLAGKTTIPIEVHAVAVWFLSFLDYVAWGPEMFGTTRSFLHVPRNAILMIKQASSSNYVIPCIFDADLFFINSTCYLVPWERSSCNSCLAWH